MVDLNKLQAQIDSLLENETDESILNWYLDQKVEKYKNLLGEGKFSNLKDESCTLNTQGIASNLARQNNTDQHLGDIHVDLYSCAA
ncbi:hypothetical protein [Pseudobacter ginsenosidimutans]|uniref:Uncharacterized protein n=1 Tax=Pseudobacter ginsenosidimutans TaxID=661488 RepID=A0A4Q7MWU5_9BACT|nr:hypothetical protein [Pseudobacter ginsenosidimutans]RZS71653.1 hypothetical protein EV199_3561 [Pseudobacter ginsenosidimutans]